MQKDKINIFSAFSGIGAFEKALDNLKRPYNLVGYCEIDKFASSSYSAVHGVSEKLNYWDITKVEPDLVKDFDIFTYGFPCFRENTLITTKKGNIPIQDININDYVLTHTGEYKKVLKTMKQEVSKFNKLSIDNLLEVSVTEEHPYLTTTLEAPSYNKYSSLKWVKVKDLNPSHRVSLANYKEISDKYNYINKSGVEKSVYLKDYEYWLLGYFISIVSNENKKINNLKETLDINDIIDMILYQGYETLDKARQAYTSIDFYDNFDSEISQELKELCYDMGLDPVSFNTDLSLNKDNIIEIIVAILFNMTRYIKHTSGRDIIISDNRSIIYTLGQLIQRLGLKYEIRECEYRDSLQLKSEELVNKRHYELEFGFYNNLVDLAEMGATFLDVSYNGVLFNRTYHVENNITVYNLEVEEDNSYVADNVIVHNCQDLSNMGKQRGLRDSEGNLTRSGLLFEALRIIESKKPGIAIAENVIALVSNKFIDDFRLMLRMLEEIGYNSYYQILNAADFGLPQTRPRVFVVSIRKDLDDGQFEFPQITGSKLKVKDILTDKSEITEKHYLTDKQIMYYVNRYTEKYKEFEASFDFLDLRNELISLHCLLTRANAGMGSNYVIEILDNLDKRKKNSILTNVLDNTNMDMNEVLDELQAANMLNAFQPKRVGRKIDFFTNDSTPKAYIKQDGTITESIREIAEDIINSKGNRRIRYLTSREGWRAQGFLDSDYDNAKTRLIEKFGDTRTNIEERLFKQAGNSIAVNVLMNLFKSLEPVISRIIQKREI